MTTASTPRSALLTGDTTGWMQVDSGVFDQQPAVCRRGAKLALMTVENSFQSERSACFRDVCAAADRVVAQASTIKLSQNA